MRLIDIAVYDIVFSAPSSAGSRVNVLSVVEHVLSQATLAEAEAMLKTGISMPLARIAKSGINDESKQSRKGSRFMKICSRRDFKRDVGIIGVVPEERVRIENLCAPARIRPLEKQCC